MTYPSSHTEWWVEVAVVAVLFVISVASIMSKSDHSALQLKTLSQKNLSIFHDPCQPATLYHAQPLPNPSSRIGSQCLAPQAQQVASPHCLHICSSSAWDDLPTPPCPRALQDIPTLATPSSFISSLQLDSLVESIFCLFLFPHLAWNVSFCSFYTSVS